MAFLLMDLLRMPEEMSVKEDGFGMSGFPPGC